MDMRVAQKEVPHEGYVLLRLQPVEGELPPILPGQFVEVRVDKSPGTLLRRPISIHDVDYEAQQMALLVHAVGDGTRAMAELAEGDTLNCLFPLGQGFTTAFEKGTKVLLVGGGVGVAPLLYYGKQLKAQGATPIFLLGARSAADLLQKETFEAVGRVCVTTEDGSLGEKGFVTNHTVWTAETFDFIATCGPKPMMVAVARAAAQLGVECEASLENLMACGLGACLCCVEKMDGGHNVCVCKEGPVFNTKRLSWLS